MGISRGHWYWGRKIMDRCRWCQAREYCFLHFRVIFILSSPTNKFLMTIIMEYLTKQLERYIAIMRDCKFRNDWTDASMTLRASDRFRKYCCLYNHRLLALIGLWPYQKLSKRLLRVTFVIFILTISILSQVNHLTLQTCT